MPKVSVTALARGHPHLRLHDIGGKQSAVDINDATRAATWPEP
ncbi:hypothetical protein [Lactococcus fujiensis]|nr:hypothetical protein [Lactococcus fujiensis]